MVEKSFAHALRRGLGSAIVELKNNPAREKYRDIVVRCCLMDIAYDTQVEGTKGYYLYTAVKTFDAPEIFLRSIAEKFAKKLYWRLSEQLYDILCCFSNDGYKIAGEALEKKYNDLKKRLPAMRNYDKGYCEREQLEKLMIRKTNDDFESFKQCVNDMGEMIIKRGNDDCLWYDWFLTDAEDKFGKKIFDFMKRAENKNISAFYQAYKKSKSDENNKPDSFKIMTLDDLWQNYRPQRNVSREERVTIEQLISRANDLSMGKGHSPFRISLLSRKFARQAKKKELEALARAALNEPSDFIKTALLHTFSFVDFPLDFELLFAYTHSGNEHLREVAAKVLSRFKDKRIHALALQLFYDGQPENALTILEANFEIEDEALIRKHILCSKRVSHSMITSIIGIYERNKSNTCGDILLHFYRNAKCTHCRCDIVETMIKNDVMPQEILEECQYDSYDETRKIATERLISSK